MVILYILVFAMRVFQFVYISNKTTDVKKACAANTKK